MIPLSWKHILISVALISAGFYATWQIQAVRLEYAKSEISKLKFQIGQCQSVNDTNQKTIEKLQREAKKISNMYDARLKTKDALISRLKHIDRLSKLETETVEVERDESNINTNSDDAILFELNSMFNKAGD